MTCKLIESDDIVDLAVVPLQFLLVWKYSDPSAAPQPISRKAGQSPQPFDTFRIAVVV
jgi:hypothetical protein